MDTPTGILISFDTYTLFHADINALAVGKQHHRTKLSDVKQTEVNVCAQNIDTLFDGTKGSIVYFQKCHNVDGDRKVKKRE